MRISCRQYCNSAINSCPNIVFWQSDWKWHKKVCGRGAGPQTHEFFHFWVRRPSRNTANSDAKCNYAAVDPRLRWRRPSIYIYIYVYIQQSWRLCFLRSCWRLFGSTRRRGCFSGSSADPIALRAQPPRCKRYLVNSKSLRKHHCAIGLMHRSCVRQREYIYIYISVFNNI